MMLSGAVIRVRVAQRCSGTQMRCLLVEALILSKSRGTRYFRMCHAPVVDPSQFARSCVLQRHAAAAVVRGRYGMGVFRVPNDDPARLARVLDANSRTIGVPSPAHTASTLQSLMQPPQDDVHDVNYLYHLPDSAHPTVSWPPPCLAWLQARHTAGRVHI
jgi:hypothetical protein